jgi:hypothetical protein
MCLFSEKLLERIRFLEALICVYRVAQYAFKLGTCVVGNEDSLFYLHCSLSDRLAG